MPFSQERVQERITQLHRTEQVLDVHDGLAVVLDALGNAALPQHAPVLETFVTHPYYSVRGAAVRALHHYSPSVVAQAYARVLAPPPASFDALFVDPGLHSGAETRALALEALHLRRTLPRTLLGHLHGHLSRFDAVHDVAWCHQRCESRCSATVPPDAPPVATQHCVETCEGTCSSAVTYQAGIVSLLLRHTHRLPDAHARRVVAHHRRYVCGCCHCGKDFWPKFWEAFYPTDSHFGACELASGDRLRCECAFHPSLPSPANRLSDWYSFQCSLTLDEKLGCSASLGKPFEVSKTIGSDSGGAFLGAKFENVAGVQVKPLGASFSMRLNNGVNMNLLVMGTRVDLFSAGGRCVTVLGLACLALPAPASRVCEAVGRPSYFVALIHLVRADLMPMLSPFVLVRRQAGSWCCLQDRPLWCVQGAGLCGQPRKPDPYRGPIHCRHCTEAPQRHLHRGC